MSTDNEFTIRVTGAAPPPLPTKGKKKATSKKSTASQQQQRRYNMRLRPSTSINQLRKDVYALFNIPTDHIKSYQMSFLSGFPPKELDQTGKVTVHELGIRPNESITIRFTLVDSSGGSTAKQSTAKVKQQQSTPVDETAAASSSVGRQKRASAMAATASFKDVIAAQDAIMKNEKKKAPKRKTTSTTGNISGFGNAAAASKKSKQPKKVKMEGSGFRLSDGKSFAGSSPSKKKTTTGKQKGEAMFKSEDDVASKLLSSFGGGSGGGGNVSKYLRSAMKGAVTKSYEASRAAVRVTAVNTGEYSFEKVKGGSLINGGTVLGTANDDDESSSTPDNGLGRTLYTVQYSKGMEGRGRYDEQVEIIGLVALKAVLNHVYDSSNGNGEEDEGGEEGSQDGRLRPVMIAQLSPRAFWSLVFHCKNAAQASSLSVDDMLRTTLPQLDWSHLERGGRKRVLSEKARENKRQTESTNAPDDATPNNGDEEAMAIEQLAESALDSAMAGNEEEVVLNERERRAKAAMARFRTDERKPQVSSTAAALATKREDMSIDDDWKLVTPDEDDIDELIECIMEGSGEGYDDDMAKAWASILVDSVQNWRVLANSNSEYIKSILSKKDCPTTTVEIIQGWIDAAQGRALEEIMLEILDGDQDALNVLQDKAKSSSPRDLVFWKFRPEVLADTLNSDTLKSWTLTDVKKWIKRAEIALGICTWLEQYTSGGLVNM